MPDPPTRPTEERCKCGLVNPGPEHKANYPLLCSDREPEPQPTRPVDEIVTGLRRLAGIDVYANTVLAGRESNRTVYRGQLLEAADTIEQLQAALAESERRRQEAEGRLLAIRHEIERKPLVIRNMTQLVGKIRLLLSPDTQHTPQRCEKRRMGDGQQCVRPEGHSGNCATSFASAYANQIEGRDG